MKPVNPNTQAKKKKNRQILLTAVLCLAFFAAGISIPNILGTTTSGSSEMSKFQNIYEIMSTKWFYADQDDDIETTLLEKAIAGMTESDEDPHTNYFSLSEAQAFSATLAGSSVGIGITFYTNADGNMVVRQVFTNSTADQAGLQRGDVIMAVGDKTASTTSTDDIVTYIKNSDGKELQLTVLRDGETQFVSVVPGEFDSTVSEEIYDNYGEIVLNSFSENSGQEFAEAIGRMQKAGVKDLIIDLRNNTGGYLSAALDISSSLLPNDTVVFVEQSANGSEKSYTTNNSYNQVEFDHIYILQNQNTASASEVLIGALKDNLPEGSVITVGDTTYGKGTEQVAIPFSDGTSLKYTIAQWVTPDGTSINNTGFEPDVAVEEDEVKTVVYLNMADDEVIEPDTVAINAEAAQIFLQYLGYETDRSDAYFSYASSEALKQFQQDNNLEATGNIDKTTFEALLNAVSNQLTYNELDMDNTRNTAIALISGTDLPQTRVYAGQNDGAIQEEIEDYLESYYSDTGTGTDAETSANTDTSTDTQTTTGE